MKTLKKILLSFLLLSIIASCVPTKKYNDLANRSEQYRKETDSLNRIVDENRYLQYDVKRLEAQLDKTKEENKNLSERFQALSQNNQALLYRFDQMVAQNQALLATTSGEKQALTDSLAAKQFALDQRERELKRIEEDLKRKEAIFNEVNSQFSNYEQQVQNLTALLDAQQSKLNALRLKINQALHGFTDSDLTISEKNGKIYVSLSQNLLFASGSDNIDWKGKKAIIQLAEVLSANQEIDINVEGHTDSTGSANKNWDLSVRRATAVVKVLTGQNVDPKRVTASGRALYDPVASNSTSADRAKNRRTEIILSPKLDELYEIINQ
jgi:chemotaxis protein MotB